MKKFLLTLDGIIKKTEVFVLIWGIILMATNNVANAIGRYFLSQSLYFSEELNSLIMVIVTFYGLGYVTRQGRHIRMSAIYDAFPKKIQKILMVIMALINMVIFFILAYYAYEYVVKTYHRGRVTPALSLPVYITYIWIVVGFVNTGIQYFLTVLKNLDFSNEEVFLSYTHEDTYEEVDYSEETTTLPSASFN